MSTLTDFFPETTTVEEFIDRANHFYRQTLQCPPKNQIILTFIQEVNDLADNMEHLWDCWNMTADWHNAQDLDKV